MSFGKDQSRIRNGNALNNIAIIRLAALNMVRRAKTKRISIKRMRTTAGWDDALLTAISIQVF
ncbi:hypothetical protein [Methylomicrobium sp. Wu6]|uniref:hypothetical protein n=1 Tax=Methylomicrobium sp. Wu6 TaxID=3107928 RepID=UPI002DD69FBC|nr:hypothetical protein [Methylomicrobium sp. Wu6]MEC4747018.1 hypothetical protein [Methylomicrobium sp. Wu6]